MYVYVTDPIGLGVLYNVASLVLRFAKANSLMRIFPFTIMAMRSRVNSTCSGFMGVLVRGAISAVLPFIMMKS